MASLDDRLQLLEERCDRLEKDAARAAPPPGWWRRFVGWMGGELPKFLAAAVLLVLGWWIKDSVDLSIKQRQLDLSYAKELQTLLQTMGRADAQKTELESTAVVLASFGEAALPALISELRYTGLRADAAAVGISTLTLTRPRDVCDVLPRVLTHRGRQFDWQAHRDAVRLLGQSECVEAVPELTRYREIVAAAEGGAPARFEALVRNAPLAPKEEYPRLLEEIDRTLRLLEGDAR